MKRLPGHTLMELLKTFPYFIRLSCVTLVTHVGVIGVYITVCTLRFHKVIIIRLAPLASLTRITCTVLYLVSNVNALFCSQTHCRTKTVTKELQATIHLLVWKLMETNLRYIATLLEAYFLKFNQRFSSLNALFRAVCEVAQVTSMIFMVTQSPLLILAGHF